MSVIKIEYLSNQRESEAVQTHKHHLLELKNLNVTVVVSMGLVLRLQKHKQIAQLTICCSTPQQGSLTKIECLSSQRESMALQTHKQHLLELENLNFTVMGSVRLDLHFHKHKQIAQLTIFNSAPQQESVIKIECLGNQREPEAVQTHKDHLLVLKNLNSTVVELMRLGLHHQMHK